MKRKPKPEERAATLRARREIMNPADKRTLTGYDLRRLDVETFIAGVRWERRRMALGRRERKASVRRG